MSLEITKIGNELYELRGIIQQVMKLQDDVASLKYHSFDVIGDILSMLLDGREQLLIKMKSEVESEIAIENLEME